jgi:hypothetical protein
MELRGRNLTYENIKAAVLEAGRFSVFEATYTSRRAALFMQLERDPEIEVVQLQFPWMGVKRRST